MISKVNPHTAQTTTLCLSGIQYIAKNDINQNGLNQYSVKTLFTVLFLLQCELIRSVG